MVLVAMAGSFTRAMKDGQGGELRIQCRESDGFCNATLMCKSAGRKWDTYNRSQNAKNFILHLQSVLGVSSDASSILSSRPGLVIHITSGQNTDRGTWVHPKIAIHLAQWMSPAFAVWVTDLVQRYISGSVISEDSQSQRAAQELSSKIVTWTKTDRTALLSDHDRKPVVYIGETLPGLIKLGWSNDILERMDNHRRIFGQFDLIAFVEHIAQSKSRKAPEV